MPRVLVTGGAGFIGSHFVDRVLQEGYPVLALDDLSFGKRHNLSPDTDLREIDLKDPEATLQAVHDFSPSHIVHFAANATTKSTSMGWKDPCADYKINMVGTLNLLEVIRNRLPHCHLLYASTAAVYGEPSTVPMSENHETFPLSPYGVSKLAGEKYCHAYHREWKTRVTILRIFNTFGPRQPRYVMYDQMKKMLAATDGTFEVLGTGEQLRDYAYVSDTVEAFFLAMNRPEASVGETFNVAGGHKISIRELIQKIKSVLGVNLQENYTGESWKGDISRLWADTTRLETALGWKPQVSLEDGLRRLAAWIQSEEI